MTTSHERRRLRRLLMPVPSKLSSLPDEDLVGVIEPERIESFLRQCPHVLVVSTGRDAIAMRDHARKICGKPLQLDLTPSGV